MKKKLSKLLLNPITFSLVIISSVQLFSRFLGFIRQFLIWDRLDPLQSDLLLSSNKLPEFLLAFFLMGTVYSAVLPIATKIATHSLDNQKLSRYLGLIFYTLSLVLLVLVCILMIWTEPFLRWFTSSELWELAKQQDLLESYILTTRILLLIPFVSAFQSILGVFLTMKKKFFVFSTAGVIANLGTILGLLSANGDIVKVAISMIWGWIIVDLLFLFVSLRTDFNISGLKLTKLKTDILEFKTDFVQTWKVFLPRILIIDGFYFSSFLINPIATNKGEITAYDIGISIQSSFFILITALGTIFFPDLSKIFYNPKLTKLDFWEKLFKYLKISLALGLVITIVTFIVSPIVLYVYSLIGKGQGNSELIVLIAQLSSISLIFRSGKEILSKYFYVRQSIWLPVVLSLSSIFIQTLVTLGLYFFLDLDSSIAVTLGFIANEFIWLLMASLYIRKDYKVFKTTGELSEAF